MTVKQQLKAFIKKNKKLFLLVTVFKLLQSSLLFKIDGGVKKYPKVLQLPITFRCNSRCVMCNIWRMDHRNEATVEEFSQFMRDHIFKEIEAVGINGGEPSLIPNLSEYANEILKLPKLKMLSIFSNGFCQKPFLKALEDIYRACREKGVNFSVAISLDGVGKIHNKVRGKSNAFEKTISTIDEIIINQYKYCDNYTVVCTIVKQNIDYLIELHAYAQSKNYNIAYHLGVDNKRIESNKIRNQYSVIYSPLRQAAKEFFHYQFSQATAFQDRFKYFSIYYWLNAQSPKRLLGCAWQDEGVTLDARGELYYCAVESDSMGSLRSDSGETMFFGDKNINHRMNIIKNNCDECIHSYNGKPELKNILIYLKELIAQRWAMKFYRIKAWMI